MDQVTTNRHIAGAATAAAAAESTAMELTATNESISEITGAIPHPRACAPGAWGQRCMGDVDSP